MGLWKVMDWCISKETIHFLNIFFKKREITLKTFYKDVSYKRMLQHIHGNVIGMI